MYSLVSWRTCCLCFRTTLKIVRKINPTNTFNLITLTQVNSSCFRLTHCHKGCFLPLENQLDGNIKLTSWKARTCIMFVVTTSNRVPMQGTVTTDSPCCDGWEEYEMYRVISFYLLIIFFWELLGLCRAPVILMYNSELSCVCKRQPFNVFKISSVIWRVNYLFQFKAITFNEVVCSGKFSLIYTAFPWGCIRCIHSVLIKNIGWMP